MNVAHHIDAEWMYCAYEMTRKDGVKGIDGVGADISKYLSLFQN
jgi:hypothetical protein